MASEFLMVKNCNGQKWIQHSELRLKRIKSGIKNKKNLITEQRKKVSSKKKRFELEFLRKFENFKNYSKKNFIKKKFYSTFLAFSENWRRDWDRKKIRNFQTADDSGKLLKIRDSDRKKHKKFFSKKPEIFKWQIPDNC